MNAIPDAKTLQIVYHIDTVIGEKGIDLSGGQKSKIAFVRLLYSNPAMSNFINP